MKFPLGRLVATPGALDRIREAGVNPAFLISRHVSADWGDLDSTDKQLNEDALKDGSRIFSAY